MRVLVLFGGDMGRVAEVLDHASEALERRTGRWLARSRDHWTEAWGFTSDRLFLNRAAILETELAPDAIMRHALAVEASLGRVRVPGAVPGPRPVDIDLLLADDHVLSDPDLTLPHPRLHERRFALAPAVDIAPGWRHPVLGTTLLELLLLTEDRSA